MPDRPPRPLDSLGDLAEGVVGRIGSTGAALAEPPAEQRQRRDAQRDEDRDAGDGPALSAQLLLATARALEELAETFPGRKADMATNEKFVRRYARSLARHSVDLRAIRYVSGICDDRYDFFPKVSQFLAAAQEAQSRFRADNPLAPSALFPGRPFDVCPRCSAEPGVAGEWMRRTCRGDLPGQPRCEHPVHARRARDGGPGRHVEWVRGFRVTYPPACEHWATEVRRETYVDARDLRDHLPHLLTEAITALGEPPAVDAGPMDPPRARWDDAAAAPPNLAPRAPSEAA